MKTPEGYIDSPVAGRFLAHVILNRIIILHLMNKIYSESLCICRLDKRTVDRIYCLRQVSGKEQRKTINCVSVDASQAFDSVNRNGMY